MCDFRHIEQIRFLSTNQVLNINEILQCRVTGAPIELPTMEQVKDVGFYHIAASGSSYAYFDGTKWLAEGRDYEVTR